MIEILLEDVLVPRWLILFAMLVMARVLVSQIIALCRQLKGKI